MNVVRTVAGLLAFVATASAASPAEKRDPAKVAAEIDKHVRAALDREKVPASPRSSDAEFLRRAYLDVIGRVPTADEARAFLDGKDPAKRSELIDDLLARPEYGDNFGRVWRLLIIPPDADIHAFGYSHLVGALMAERFNRGEGWDRIVRRLMAEPAAATPRPTRPEDVNVPKLCGIVSDKKPNVTVASHARLFLGVKLLCAECHDAKTQPWRQDDYWGLVAAYLGQRGATIPDNGESKRVGETIPSRLLDGKPGTATSTKTGVKGPTGKKGAVGRAATASGPFLDWMTAADNAYFTGNAVNRWWHHFMGRGLVEPLGDFHEKNPPSHPEVMDLLRAEFAASGLDVRHLVRCVCSSETYQRSGDAVPGNADDRKLYARHPARPLTADQLYDSLRVVTGWSEVNLEPVSALFNLGAAEGRPKPSTRDRFVNFFANARTQDDDPTAYRRGVPQALNVLNTALNKTTPAVEGWRAAKLTPERAVETAVLATLSRRPTADEARLLRDYLGGAPAGGDNYVGLLWVLLNSGEFHVNR